MISPYKQKNGMFPLAILLGKEYIIINIALKREE